ncbi:hypothetical protein KCTCHS21_51470 [Cohnella abietis]|uniref:Uncharacterized protein n=1 Tax=Cohnella abietis TaxID=2507935 RepID=A0A3T1DCR2_9BACL|nr:hypothetical protein KCTCHS21_51470 [Cohnella abietis]
MSQLKDGKKLTKPLLNFITKALDLSKEETSLLNIDLFYEVDLGGLPTGYTRQFVALFYHSEGIELVLLASNADASKIKLLDRAQSSDEGSLFVNTAKLEISTNKNQIEVWTQYPFRASYTKAVLEWSSNKLKVISHEYGDPTAEFFDKKKSLLRNKDILGLIDLENSEDPFYPSAYEGNYTLGAPTLVLAHQKALAIHKKNIKAAISYLEYGFSQYSYGYGPFGYSDGTVTKEDFVASEYDSYPESRMSLNVYVGIYNDYGYFLSLDGRNKEAKLVLSNVIKLVPTRTVAYLNIADVEWTLGQKTAAKEHYKQYIKLLGSKATSIAPKRVQERLKAK